MKLLLRVILLISFTSISNAQWFFQQTPNQSYYLYGVNFTNSQVGWAVGRTGVGGSGVILKTVNGGTNWIRLTVSSPPLWGVSFSDEKNGTVVGEQATILRTTDGGDTWVKQTPPVEGSNFISISNTDQNTGNIVSGKFFFRTTDGGNSWSSKTLDTSAGLYRVFFLDKNHGIIAGDSIYITHDGGLTWDKKHTWYFYRSGLCMTDSATAFITGLHGELYKTTDGGNTWIDKTIAWCQNSCSIGGISFGDKKHGYYVAKYCAIYKTTDGGDSWFQQQATKPSGVTWSPHLYAVSYADSLNCTAVGESGAIVHTSTGGLTDVKKNKNISTSLSFQLGQNFPNPFNPVTNIHYSIACESKVSITLYNTIGQKVKELVNEIRQAGSYELKFDGSEFPSGIYFYQLNAGGFCDTKKLLILK